MYTNFRQLFVVIAFAAVVQSLHAGDATWNLNPGSNNWNTAQNWTPQTVPNSTTAVATFGMSNTTTVLCQKSVNGIDASTYVGDIVFAPGANAYTIRITPDSDVIFPSIIEFHGSGVINNSGIVQNLVTANSGTTKASGRIYFMNSASPGENVVITNEDGGSAIGDGVYGGFTALEDTSNAANATFINEGGEVSGTIYGGFTNLLYYSSSESATLHQ